VGGWAGTTLDQDQIVINCGRATTERSTSKRDYSKRDYGKRNCGKRN